MTFTKVRIQIFSSLTQKATRVIVISLCIHLRPSVIHKLQLSPLSETTRPNGTKLAGMVLEKKKFRFVQMKLIIHACGEAIMVG